jgi:hypothetical protein
MRKPTARSIHKQQTTATQNPVQLSTEPERIASCVAAIQRTKSPRDAGDLVLFRADVYPSALEGV